ncbi:MAG TPA: cation transporter [Ignavibacteria bacterium]|jgi:copper chaperone CopZ
MENTIKEILNVNGMTCGHCVHAVEEELKKLPLEKFNVSIGKVKVEYDDKKIKKESIIYAIKEAGYSVAISNFPG